MIGKKEEVKLETYKRINELKDIIKHSNYNGKEEKIKILNILEEFGGSIPKTSL